jgi:hypothetical protein
MNTTRTTKTSLVPKALRRGGWFLLPIVTGGVMLAQVPSAQSANTGDPTLEPIPDFTQEAADETKSVAVAVHFDDRFTAAVNGASVVDERPRSHLGDPPLLKVEVRDLDGNVLETMNHGHPLWRFAEDANGDEYREILDSADETILATFDRDMAEVRVSDGMSDTLLATADLTAATTEWCIAHPSDEDCKEADLATTSVSAPDAPPLVLVGGSAPFTVRTEITNLGPDGPVDATITTNASVPAGVTLTPSSATAAVESLAVAGTATRDSSWTVACQEPGVHDIDFTSTVSTVHPADVDLNASNNSRSATISIDCAVPVTVNIKPGGDPNAINRTAKSDIPVAVLTTAAGEYGNPLAFDATTIVADSVRFGNRLTVLAGGGASETHGSRHDERSYELNEKTRDADLDAMLHFGPTAANFAAGDTEGCIRGTFIAGAQQFTFYGCGPIAIVN